MLVEFRVQNWLSFRDEATLSMVASRERQHKERVPRSQKHKLNLLPIAAIYGGNASGKTNLFLALRFVRRLVVHGTQPDQQIHTIPFLLDEEFAEKPTVFSIQLLAGDDLYEYSFSVTKLAVLEETLASEREGLLFARRNGRPVEWCIEPEDLDRLRFIAQGTRSNQLLLHNLIAQNHDMFRPIFNWFRDTLVTLDPTSRYRKFGRLVGTESEWKEKFEELLRGLDTNIDAIGEEVVPIESLMIPKEILDQELAELAEDQVLAGDIGPDRFTVSYVDGQPIARKLTAIHSSCKGKRVAFGLGMESDGSIRALDLIPAFLQLTELSHPRVYVIDEIGVRFHTHLTRHLLEFYLAACSEESRNQLLFTTHDILQMDQSLLRRDEMWLTERDYQGATTLYSVADFKHRFDKDLRKQYLQGRLGGVPRLGTILK